MMATKLFKRIEQFFLKPTSNSSTSNDFWTQAKTGPMRDPGEKMDVDVDMDDDTGDSEHVEEEDNEVEVKKEESEEEFFFTDDEEGEREDCSMDILVQEIANVELREGLDEDLSQVAGRLNEMMMGRKEGMDDRMTE